MAFIDDKVIQRMLFVSSDKIADGLREKNWNSFKGVRLHAGGQIPPEKQVIVYRNQQSLFSDSIMTSGEAANNLFKDNKSDIPIDSSYTISNNIMLYLYEPDNGANQYKQYYFNIDELNSYAEDIFISKLIIKNKSKDIFTLKANYQITLKINYNFFDNLLEQKITAHLVSDPKKTRKISVMELLYKYYNADNLPQSFKHTNDATGIFVIQNLIMKNNDDRFKSLINDLGGDNVITKNYHLTYHKHNFDCFKSEDAYFKYFENELTIEYIAYETDGQEKPLPGELQNYFPQTNFNLYSILEDPPYLGDVYSADRAQQILGYINDDTVYKQFSKNKNTIDILSQQLACKNLDEAYKKQIEVKLQELSEKQKKIASEANRLLIFKLMGEVWFFNLNIPYSILKIYDNMNFVEYFKQNYNPFSLKGLATFGQLAISATGGLAGVGIFGISQIVSAVLATDIKSEMFDLSVVREEVAKAVQKDNPDFEITTEQNFLELLFLNKSTQDANKPTQREKASIQEELPELIRDKDSQELKDMFDKITKIEVKKANTEEASRTVSIHFTTFGQILNLIKKYNKSNLSLISGGFFLDVDKLSDNISYVNFADIPISMNNFSNFLYNMLEGTNRALKYDSELFLKDCYENLIKKIISDGSTIIPSLKNSTPNNIKVVSTVHYVESKNTDLIKQNLYLDASTEEFNKFKLDFIKSKNFNLGSGTDIKQNLYKFYVFGTFDDIKYFDFYEDYLNNNTKKNKYFNTDDFQNYINKKHLIPCLLSKRISDAETVLKKKYVNYSRIDNTNLNTGNFLNKSGLLRYPYQFKSDFKAFMWFFNDIGSHIFIAPPAVSFEKEINMFGYGGLYIIRTSELEYNFQKIQEGKLTLPNLESKVTLDGYMISHGDSIKINQQKAQQEERKQKLCSQKFLSDTPASLETITLSQVNTMGAGLAISGEWNQVIDIQNIARELTRDDTPTVVNYDEIEKFMNSEK